MLSRVTAKHVGDVFWDTVYSFVTWDSVQELSYCWDGCMMLHKWNVLYWVGDVPVCDWCYYYYYYYYMIYIAPISRIESEALASVSVTVTYLLCTVSDKRRIIGPIFPVNRRYFSLTHSFFLGGGGEPLNPGLRNVAPRNQKRSSIVYVWSKFRYIEPFRDGSPVWHRGTGSLTDERTDIVIANAALHYVDRPKIANNDHLSRDTVNRL